MFSPVMSGAFRFQGSLSPWARSRIRLTFKSPEPCDSALRLAPLLARIRISTACSRSEVSSPSLRSTYTMGKLVVLRPCSRPSSIRNDDTPAPAFHPKVAGDSSSGFSGVSANSQRPAGSGRVTCVGTFLTIFWLKWSTSRIAIG